MDICRHRAIGVYVYGVALPHPTPRILLHAHQLGAHLLGTHVTWADAFAIEAFISVARGFNTVVPGALGVQEFSVVGLFTLFGYGHELGAQYAVVRRGRDVAFAVLGWLLLYVGEAAWKSLRAEPQAEGNH